MFAALALMPDRKLDIAAAIASAVVLLAGVQQFESQRNFYPGIVLGMSTGEVRYGFGTPSRVVSLPGGVRWEYDTAETEQYARFADGFVVEAGCRVRGNDCPPILGMSTADVEDYPWARLGVPERQMIHNGSKTLYYDDIGLKVRLELFKIRDIAIEAEGRSLIVGMRRLILLLMP